MRRFNAPSSARAAWMNLPAPWLRVGHRGAGGLEPQNTARSFERALACGADMVETDLRRAADGALVLAHDPHITGTDERRWEVSERTLAELREVDLREGERILTLEDLLTLCRNRCAVMIDLKGEGFEAELVETLRRAAFTDVIIPGGSDSSRALLRELDPAIPLSLSLGGEWKPWLDDDFFAALETKYADAVTWHDSLLDADIVARLHEGGRYVFAWTVDDPAEMDRLIQAGVDGIISNRPDLLSIKREFEG